VVPERGPSEIELAHLRCALASHPGAENAVKVLMCLPPEVSDAASVREDLAKVADMVLYGVDPGTEVDLEAVWVSTALTPSLAGWLERLGGNDA